MVRAGEGKKGVGEKLREKGVVAESGDHCVVVTKVTADLLT